MEEKRDLLQFIDSIKKGNVTQICELNPKLIRVENQNYNYDVEDDYYYSISD